MATANCHVDVHIEQASAVLSLHRPDALNALNENLLSALQDAVEAVIASSDVKTICIRGSQSVFMSGADVAFFLRAILKDDLDRILRFTSSGHRVLDRLANCPKPTVAFVEGVAFGAGLELALSCQKVVAAPAARFSLPESGLGIYPGMGGTQRLPRRIGIGLAKWMIYTGAIVPAEHALQIGLVDAIEPPTADLTQIVTASALQTPARLAQFDELEAFFSSHNVAEILAPASPLPKTPHLARAVIQVRGKAPQALKIAEALIDAGASLPVAEAIELELSRLGEVFSTADARTGLLSLGKSRPKFVGA